MPLALTHLAFHFAMLDGSAAIAADKDHFFCASDEDNVIALCALAGGKADPALKLNDLKDWFHPDAKKPHEGDPPNAPPRYKEADIESATLIGEDEIVWITSHARDSEAKKDKPERCRLFATRIIRDGISPPRLEKSGVAYDGLLGDLRLEQKFKSFDLDGASKLPPKSAGGFNIESLCAEHDGSRLFIGLRGPVREKKALLLPLRNAPRLISGEDVHAEFDDAITLNLNPDGVGEGLGVRDMIWWPERLCYLIVGGHVDEHMGNETAPRPRLFTWDGNTAGRTVALDVELKVDGRWLNPEGLIHFDDGRILVLSDDGALKPEGSALDQKDMLKAGTPIDQLSFRAVWLEDK